MIQPFVTKPFDPYVPDVLIEDVLALQPYGIRALAGAGRRAHRRLGGPRRDETRHARRDR